MMNYEWYWILNDKMKDKNGLITWNGLSIPSDSDILVIWKKNQTDSQFHVKVWNRWWLPSDDEFKVITCWSKLITTNFNLIVIMNFEWQWIPIDIMILTIYFKW